MDSEVIARLKEQIRYCHYRDHVNIRVDELKALIRAAELSEARRRVCEEWDNWNRADQLVGTDDEVDVNANSAWGFLELAKAALAALEAEGAG